jgi:hypothetical protein
MSLFPPFSRLIANTLANYSKRFADQSLWDRLIATPWGQRLHHMPRSSKFLAEMAMYLGDFAMKESIGSETPVRLFWSEFLGDAAPELAKRILNGDSLPRPRIITIPSKPSGLEKLNKHLRHWSSRL